MSVSMPEAMMNLSLARSPLEVAFWKLCIELCNKACVCVRFWPKGKVFWNCDGPQAEITQGGSLAMQPEDQKIIRSEKSLMPILTF